MATAEPNIQPVSVPLAGSIVQNSDLSSQNISDDTSKPEQDDNPPVSPPSPRPLRIYTRPQILALSKSSLVTLPPNMPELKDWFGAENEQNLNKKDSEPSTPNSGRERRFRRDAEEGDLPARPSFRSSLSQPSQMGNFKHQSLRSNDRDRDVDKDRDRDGQERLRNLSDKYDRDRLAIPLSGLRTKDRDIAPHLASSSRLSSQPQSTIAARRAEAREATKKKIGEASEDWRRAPDSRRSERVESGRGERDERPRSRSRHRRDQSLSRRDRDREEARRDRDREREDYKRERERDREDMRRDRERDEEDDSRRWRDDGKRDERMAARRDRERARDKEGAWDSSNDRRWTSLEDRDARSKRNTGREKKSAADETRGDERRGERDKEKEPAWMEPYVPPPSSGGILGGKGGDGELDGLQAWKKNMKEKEQKANKASDNESSKVPSESLGDFEESMDEIQKFKVMMRLAQKSRQENISGDLISSEVAASPSRENKNTSQQTGDTDPAVVVSAKVDSSVTATSDPSRSLLSLLNPTESRGSPHPPSSSADPANASVKPLSRLPLAEPSSAERAPVEATSTTSAQFNPPQGSRLLALSNRVLNKPPALSNQSLVSQPLPNGTSAPTGIQSASKVQLSALSNTTALLSDSAQSLPKLNARTPLSFSPFEEQREANDISRRPPERPPFIPESGSWPDSAPIDASSAGHAIGKGSRFAKFFDGKGKEQPPVSAPPAPNKAPTPVGFVSSSPGPHVRPDSGFGGVSSQNIEHRTVDDLFAKLNLNNSLPQNQRSIPVPNSAPSNSSMSFGQQAQNQLYALQQQQLQSHNHQLHGGARLEPLYESRNFMPDNLVPGLRSAPPARNRESGGMFPDPLDEAILLNSQQRLPVQQQRGIEQPYAGSAPTSFAQQQASRNGGMPIQPPQFRGGPSPLSAQHNVLHGAQQQRLPPGLANLGGRPPHDPSQFLGMPGLSSQGVHAGLHVNGPPQQQQSFNNFHSGGNIGFGAPQTQLRAPPPGAHQLQNSVVHHQLGNLGHPSNLDVRSASQAQLLALNGIGSSGIRGGQFNPQQANSTQLQSPLVALRQQQGPLPPHMMPHLLPPHLQQQSPSLPNNQTANAQDLMALLMGTHRD